MNSEDANVISHLIGDFGRWQATVSLLVSLLKLPIGWFQLSIVFLAPATPFWCRVPLLRSSGYPNATASGWRNETLNDCDVRCSEYQFDTTVFKRTIISEWLLICEKEQLANVVQMSFMLGVLVGNVVFGVASDRFGRKIPLIIAIVLQGVTSFMVGFVPWFFWFLILRFLLAISTGGIMVTSFVLCVEMVSGKWRTSIPILYQIPFGLANSIMAVMAYFLRDWRKLTFTMSIISMSFVSYWWLVPESPRWLLAVGKHEQAAKILEKAAKMNNLKSKDVASVVSSLNSHYSAIKKPSTNSPPFLGLFKTPNLRKNTLILFFNWFVAGMSVFGFSQYISFIGKNEDIFTHFAVGGLVTIPGTLICIFVVNRFGRRTTIISSGFLYGITCILVAVIPAGAYPHDWPKVLLAGVSLTCMSVAFPALYLYAGELFPTVARNGGLGASSMFARIGSMIAPFVLSTRIWGEFVPLVILGSLPIVAVALIISMPETKGCSLPDSLEDGENFGKIKLRCSSEHLKMMKIIYGKRKTNFNASSHVFLNHNLLNVHSCLRFFTHIFFFFFYFGEPSQNEKNLKKKTAVNHNTGCYLHQKTRPAIAHVTASMFKDQRLDFILRGVSDPLDAMTEKQLLNSVENCVEETLRGFSKLHPNLFVDSSKKIVLNTVVGDGCKVALISGGGSGHEPFPAGYVGEGMLTCSVSGPVFTSPPSQHILHGIRLAAAKSSGVLLIVPNYTGDVLNFGLAAETALEEGIPVESVIVGEDVAQEVRGPIKKTGRRGMCGLVLVMKIGGYLAEVGHELQALKKFCEEVVRSTASMGLCASACCKPGVGPLFQLKRDEMELGVGVHGEAGIARVKMLSAQETVQTLLDFLIPSLMVTEGDEAVAMLNNLGSLSCLEMWLLAGELEKQLKERQIKVSRLYAGCFFTSLNMAGLQICLLKLRPETKEMFLAALDHPTTVSGWTNKATHPLDHENVPVVFDRIIKTFSNGFCLSSDDSEFLRLCFIKIHEELTLNEKYLNHLDSACGDGDCGTTFGRLAHLVKSFADKSDFSLPADLFRDLSLAIEESIGGTTGALYSLFCKGCSKQLGTLHDFDCALVVSKGWRAGVEAIKKYSAARIGDRTMLDSLETGCEAFERQLNLEWIKPRKAFENAVKAAKEGCQKTKHLDAFAGRASYTDPAWQKDVDAGAYAVTLWLSAIQHVVKTRAGK